MRFEYCCEKMRESINDGRMKVNEKTQRLWCLNDNYEWCPYCGERIEIEVKVRR